MSRQLRNLKTKNLKKKKGLTGIQLEPFNLWEISTVLLALRAGHFDRITPVEDKNKKWIYDFKYFNCHDLSRV